MSVAQRLNFESPQVNSFYRAAGKAAYDYANETPEQTPSIFRQTPSTVRHRRTSSMTDFSTQERVAEFPSSPTETSNIKRNWLHTHSHAGTHYNTPYRQPTDCIQVVPVEAPMIDDLTNNKIDFQPKRSEFIPQIRPKDNLSIYDNQSNPMYFRSQAQATYQHPSALNQEDVRYKPRAKRSHLVSQIELADYMGTKFDAQTEQQRNYTPYRYARRSSIS